MIKVRDKFVLHSENGMDYEIEVVNVNEFREPSMKYACDIVDGNGVSYWEAYKDYYFCGDDFLSKCEKI